MKEIIVARPPARRLARRRAGNRRQPKSLLGQVATGVGTLIGAGLRTFVRGFGDYKVASNTLMTGGLDPPTIINTVSNGGTIFRHREYLQDISASIVFTSIVLPLNPGIITTFPWLSAVAQHFEQYKFRGMIFEFKSLASDAVLSSATSSALGSIVMATQYNSLSPPFPDKFTMENYEFANSNKPSISFIHPVECQRAQTPVYELFVRGEAAPAGSDIRLFDLGNFQISTVGMQAALGVVGELWVTYEVECFKPKISNPIAQDALVDHFLLSTSATNTNPFLSATLTANSTLGGTITNSGHGYTWPSNISDGLYLVYWQYNGTSVAITGASITFSALVFNNMFRGNSTGHVQTAGTTGNYFDIACVAVTSAGANITYTLQVLPSSPTSGDLFVIQVPSNLTHFLKANDYMETVPIESVYEENEESDYDEIVRLLKDLMSTRQNNNILS